MKSTSSSTKAEPLRGEIWDVDLNPTIGAEMSKIRPVVVLSSDALRSLPLRLVAPVTEWKDHYRGTMSHIPVKAQKWNGLIKDSAVDTLQLRCLSLERFRRKRGILSADQLEEIILSVAAVIEYQ